MTVRLANNDLPDLDCLIGSIAIDTEAMGLLPHRDRLCLVQLCDERQNVFLVQIEKGQTHAPNLKALLEDATRTKIFHYARFDVGLLMHALGIKTQNIFCTKIASRLCRTYTSKHGLKDLCKDLLNIELSKEEQTSDWGAASLSEHQMRYAAQDVLYLHQLKHILQDLLIREDRDAIAQSCFQFIQTRAVLDLLAGDQFDIFSHKAD
ncbi:MAG: Ribonuclease D [Holosporales bacterium]